MSEICDVIQERLNGNLKITADSEQRTKNVAYLKRVFELLTSEGLKKYLDKFLGGDIAQAIEKFRKE